MFPTLTRMGMGIDARTEPGRAARGGRGAAPRRQGEASGEPARMGAAPPRDRALPDPGRSERPPGATSTRGSRPSERALRKGRAQLLAAWKHKNEGTPETHEQASRRNQGALANLYKNGSIDAEQLASAVEIAMVAERIASDVAVRTASLETRVDVTRLGDGSFFERLGQVRRDRPTRAGDRSCGSRRRCSTCWSASRWASRSSPRGTGCTTARRSSC
jgi:hypothetical protein